MNPAEVFLSHSSADQNLVSPLVDLLRKHHIPVWYSKTSIVGAQQWHDEIGSALKRCDWFILVLTPNAVSSTWVKRELLYALQQNHFENKIIPLIYQECDPSQLSWVLSSYQIVNFKDDFESGCKDLLRIWGLGYNKALY